MSRQKVEKAIVKSLAVMLSGLFEKSAEDFSSKFNHSVTFSRALDDDITIDIVLWFSRSHGLTLDTHMWVFHKKVQVLLVENGLLNTQFPSVPVIYKAMEDFFAGGMRKGMFYLEHDGKGLEGIDINETAAKINARYFQYVLKTLEPSIDSLEKLNGLINSEKYLQGDQVVPAVYNSPRQNQILTGLALAILVKPDTYSAVMSTYRKFLTNYIKPGEDELVDLARTLIAKYAPA